MKKAVLKVFINYEDLTQLIEEYLSIHFSQKHKLDYIRRVGDIGIDIFAFIDGVLYEENQSNPNNEIFIPYSDLEEVNRDFDFDFLKK